MIKKIKLLSLFLIMISCSVKKSVAQKEVLNISGKNYTEIEIANILKSHSFLKELNISNSNLNSIPSSVFKLNNLELLYLDNNNIKSIPDDIKKLEKLRSLSLSGNYIKHVTPEVLKSKSLKYVLLIGEYDRNEVEMIKSKFCKRVKLKFYIELPSEYGLMECNSNDSN